MRSMVRWTAKFSSWTESLGLRTARFLASASRQVSISFRNSASTVAVPRFLFGDGVLVERAFEDRVLGEDGCDLVPSGQVVPIGAGRECVRRWLCRRVWAIRQS